jgi:hypothetical protein
MYSLTDSNKCIGYINGSRSVAALDITPDLHDDPEMAMECSKLNQGLSEEIQGSHQQGGHGRACKQAWKGAWNIEPGEPYNTTDNILSAHNTLYQK